VRGSPPAVPVLVPADDVVLPPACAVLPPADWIRWRSDFARDWRIVRRVG